MQLAHKCHYLHRLIVYCLSCFRICCLYAHVLHLSLYCLSKAYFVILYICCRDWSNLRWLKLLGIGQVKHNRGADQLSIDIGNIGRTEWTISEVFVTILIIPTDQSSKSKLSFSRIKNLILDQSSIPWFRLTCLNFITTKGGFNRHESCIIIWTSQFDVHSPCRFNLKNKILAQLVSHLFLNLEIFIHEIVVVHRVSDKWLAFIAFAETYLYVSRQTVGED